MTEERILDRACLIIARAIRHYIDHNDIYRFGDMQIDIRTEVARAMEAARREALRGN